MTAMDRITDNLRLSLEGEAWHGPSVFEALQGITPAQASARPLPNGHTIWEILLHITIWVEEAVVRLRGLGRNLELNVEWPTPPAAGGNEAWQESLDRLRRAEASLIEELGRTEDARLDLPIAEGFSSVYNSLHGIIQHNVYHAGQIVLLKKLV